MPEEEIEVFQNIESKTIDELCDLVNEDCVVNGIEIKSIKKIVKGFSDEEARHIGNALYNFAISYNYPNKLLKIIDDSKLQQNKKDKLKQELKKIHERLNKDKIKLKKSSSFLEDFGHPHIHKLSIVSEFRPLTDNNKIIKLIPSFVVSGTAHNPDLQSEEQVLNFQLTVGQAERILKDLSESLKNIKEEIELMRRKFGDDIID